MSDFPNFFYVLGPNSGKGHTSAIYCIEKYVGLFLIPLSMASRWQLCSYVNLVMKVIAPVIQDRCSFVEVNPNSEKDYNEELHEKIATTIFNSSCGSVSKNIPLSSVVIIYIWYQAAGSISSTTRLTRIGSSTHGTHLSCGIPPIGGVWMTGYTMWVW